MVFFVACSKLHLKRIIATKFYVAGVMVLLCALGLCVSLFEGDRKNTMVNVGIVYDQDDMLQNDIFMKFSSKENINAIMYENCDRMIKDVKSGKIECGYVVNDLQSKITEGDLSGIVELISSPASTVTGFINELMYSSIIKAASATISLDYLNSLGVESTLPQVRSQIEDYYKKDLFMQVNYLDMSNLHDNNNATNLLNEQRIVHGIIAFFCFLSVYFTAARLIDEQKRSLYKKLSKKKAGINIFAQCFSVFVSAILSAVAALLFLSIVKQPFIGGFLREFILISAFAAILVSLSCIAVFTIKSSETLYLNFPFIAVVNLVFGGFFVDFAEISKPLANISALFPSAYYISGALNTTDNSIIWMSFCICLCIPAFFALYYRREI